MVLKSLRKHEKSHGSTRNKVQALRIQWWKELYAWRDRVLLALCTV